MLWEAADPVEVLRGRFGLSGAEDAVAWVRHTTRLGWGVEVQECDSLVMSDHNALAWCRTSGGRVILKWCVDPSRFARLSDATRVTDWLARQGLPVSAPITALDGSVQTKLGNTSANLQHVVPGSLLDVGDLNQVRVAGTTLARLHTALAKCPIDTPSVPFPEHTLGDQVMAWLASSPAHMPTDCLRTLREILPTAALVDPPQLVQGDYRAANLIMGEQRVEAVLDFEEIRRDHPVRELARASVLIGTLFHDWAPVDADVRTSLLDGYEQHRRLAENERAWLDALILWWGVLMIPPGDDPAGWTDKAKQIAQDLNARP